MGSTRILLIVALQRAYVHQSEAAVLFEQLAERQPWGSKRSLLRGLANAKRAQAVMTRRRLCRLKAAIPSLRNSWQTRAWRALSVWLGINFVFWRLHWEERQDMAALMRCLEHARRAGPVTIHTGGPQAES